MPSLSSIDSFVDSVTATDHEIAHATQEAIYFFFIIFLVELKWWPDTAVYVGCLLLLLALFRILYYLGPYFLEHRLASLLSLEQRIRLVSARESQTRDELEALLRLYFRSQSAARLTDLLLRHNHQRLRRLMKVG